MIGEKRITRYLLYALGEIVLVVVGILIALQINNWNASRVKRQDEIKSYQNIRRQIVDDLNEIKRVRDFNGYFIAQFEYGIQIARQQDQSSMDTLARIVINLSQYSDFHSSGNIYETIVNSGDLKLLKNSDITSALQKLEMTYTNVNKLEDIHWDIIMQEFSPEIKGAINYSTFEIVRPEKLYSVEIQNIMVECVFLMKGKDTIYNKALNEIESIISLIDAELEESD